MSGMRSTSAKRKNDLRGSSGPQINVDWRCMFASTTVNAVNGVATFSNLHVTGLCTGCTLQATATGLAGATSSSFNVVAGP